MKQLIGPLMALAVLLGWGIGPTMAQPISGADFLNDPFEVLALIGLLVALAVLLGWGTGPAVAQPVSGADFLNDPFDPFKALVWLIESQNKADAPRYDDNRLDLNHATTRDFARFKGLYPSAAMRIVKNAPYKSVEEVLNVPGLSPQQLEDLRNCLDDFRVTVPDSASAED